MSLGDLDFLPRRSFLKKDENEKLHLFSSLDSEVIFDFLVERIADIAVYPHAC